MLSDAQKTVVREKLASVFEHAITWEDDVWKGDPFDVDDVHRPARRKFLGLLKDIAEGNRTVHARILLFHGQSGAGKTHLIRALRTRAHIQNLGYFGYAQMTPDVSNYADYFLRRMVNSLEKPYCPLTRAESGLMKLSNLLIDDPEAIDPEYVEHLQEAPLDADALARLVVAMADEVLCAPKFADQELDINIVRALLYLQRRDPRIDQRVRTYLYGRPLNDLSHAAVAALDPNDGQDRSFEIIESLGRLMRIVDNASLVFCIDQVEDLRFFDDAEHRFQNAIKDLIQLANRVPSSIVIISCLGDFYEQVRSQLPQSYTDRIEQSGPVLLKEARNAEEARLIVSKRIEAAFADGDGVPAPDMADLLGPDFFQENAGLSTRRLLERVHLRLSEVIGRRLDEDERPRLVEPANGDPVRAINDLWERFEAGFEVDTPDDENDQLGVLSAVLTMAQIETGNEIQVQLEPLDWADELAAADLSVRLPGNQTFVKRLFMCNRMSQGGGLKRQLERVIGATEGRSSFIIRASDFPANARSGTGQLLRRLQSSGNKKLTIPMWEWERMIALLEFQQINRTVDGFEDWLRSAKLLSDLPSISQLLRLDLVSHGQASFQTGTGRAGAEFEDLPADLPVAAGAEHIASPGLGAGASAATEQRSGNLPGMPSFISSMFMRRRPEQQAGEPVAESPVLADMPLNVGRPSAGAPMEHMSVPATARVAGAAIPPNAAQLALGGDDATNVMPFVARGNSPAPVAAPPELKETVNRFSIGQKVGQPGHHVMLSKDILRRHAAVLGGSGSGKTTLALSLIEQLLARGIPAVLIDRKGDLCSYANPDVWREISGEEPARRAQREELGSGIDVAVYTPGRRDGRPISITLLPNGVGELPEQEQMLLANVSAAALGEMLHLGTSSTHQRMSGILSVALRLIGERSTSEVTLDDLIYRLENDDEEIIELTQRMDPTGKARRDLIAQLDSLRHRNAALFDGHGEPLRMESLLGRDGSVAQNRTRLSIIYTGFLGDNENVLFWISQFLTEALRFTQRNPSDALQAVIMFDEADLYIPANSKPATKEPLESLLKRARSAGIGIMLATQSPGDLDYRSRDQITSWFIGRVREDTALKKLRAAFQSESGLDPARALPGQTVGEFHLIQEGLVQPMKSRRSLINAEQVPFDRIEQLSRETKGNESRQLRLDLL